MNQVRNLLIILVLVTLLQSLVTLAILTTERQTQSNIVVLQQQLADVSTRLSRVSTALDAMNPMGGMHRGPEGPGGPGGPPNPGMPNPGERGEGQGRGNGNGGGEGRGGGNGGGNGNGEGRGRSNHQVQGTGEYVARGDGIVKVLAELMVLMGNKETMLTSAQSEQIKARVADFKKGQHDGLRKYIHNILTPAQTQYLSAHATEVEDKSNQLHKIPNSDDGMYADLTVEFIDNPLRPDGQAASPAASPAAH